MSLPGQRPTTTPAVDRCPVCGREVNVLGNGRLRRHGYTIRRPGSDCRGSGGPPDRAAHVEPPRLHDRRTE